MSKYDNLTENGTPHEPVETRLAAIEADLKTIKAKLAHLETYVVAHEKGVWNLSERMTRESLTILDIIGDMQDKLNPVYDRVIPGLGAFEDEVNHALTRRKF